MEVYSFIRLSDSGNWQTYVDKLFIITARQYVSAVFAVTVLSVCSSVRQSQPRRPVLYRTTERIELVFGIIPHCVVRKFEYVQKLGYFPLDLRPKLRTFGKFRHGKSVALSTTLVVVVDGGAC